MNSPAHLLSSLSSFTYPCPAHVFVSALNSLTSELQDRPLSTVPFTTAAFSPEVVLGVVNSLAQELAFTPSPTSRLPREVLGRCFELVCDSSCDDSSCDGDHKECYKTWNSASLVCKAWRDEAQRNLFSDIYIDDIWTLHLFVSGPAFGVRRTKSLRLVDPTQGTVSYEYGKRGKWVEDDIETLITGSVGIKHLEIRGVKQRWDRGSFQLREEVFISQNLADLTTLVLHSCRISDRVSEEESSSEESTDDEHELYDQFDALPAFELTSLTLDRTTLDSRSQGYIFHQPTIKILSLTLDKSYTRNHTGTAIDTELLRVAGNQLTHLKLKILNTMPDFILEKFACLICLTDLTIWCGPKQLIAIAQLLPSQLLSLTLTDIRFGTRGNCVHPDYPSAILAAIEEPSMKNLEELWIANISRGRFIKKAVEGEKMLSLLREKGVETGFKTVED